MRNMCSNVGRSLLLACCAVGVISARARGGLVDVELRPATQTVFIGDTVEIALYAVSADGGDQEVGLVGAVVNWDPSALTFSGHSDDGPFVWSSSGFPSESAGLNEDLTDGDLYYQAVVSAGGARATATASGLLVTTLRFAALPGATGDTQVSLVICVGSTCTWVLDRHPFDAGVQEITDVVGGPVQVTIHCQNPSDCDDSNACTDDSCAADSECANVPNDANDPDDGLFCNGLEIGCDNGRIIIEPGSIPDCDDGLACTSDSCIEATDQCDHTLEPGFCLIVGMCHGDGAVNPANECQICDTAIAPEAWTAGPAGAVCGNQGEDDCDHADGCDGNGACSLNLEPFGWPCGDQTNDECTAPDTCDGSGGCLPNHADNGTPCNDDRFCTVTDGCQEGLCVGTGDRCPGQTCNESLDLCKAISLEWRDVLPQPVAVGDIVEVDLYAISDTGVNQVFSSVSVILIWNASYLQLLGHVNNGPYSWLSSGFPDDSSLDGLNDTFLDGTAFFQTLGQLSPNPVATATPSGLQVMTMRFEALAPVQAQLNMKPRFGQGTHTAVLDIEPPGLVITGTLGSAAAIEIVECLGDPACDDEDPCTGQEKCLANQCVAGIPLACSDGEFCNGIEVCDSDLGCISPGNPCPDPGTCDETAGNCGGCDAPAVVAEGARYLAVTPVDAAYPVAMLVTGEVEDPDVSCFEMYVQDDGSLGPIPVFKLAAQWSTAHVTGLAIRPNTTYTFQTDCTFLAPDLLSSGSSATTWVWGDVNGDGDVLINDVTLVLDGSQGVMNGGVTIQNLDLAPCRPDGVIDQADIAAVQNAFAAGLFPCTAPCAPPGPNDYCFYATSVGEGTFAFDSTGAATDGPDESTACDSLGDAQIGSDLWYCYTPTCTGTATVSLCGSSYDTKLALYEGCSCPQPLSAVACDDDTCGMQSEVSVAVIPCRRYLVRVGGSEAAQGSGVLTIACQAGPPAQDCNENGIADECDLAAGTSKDLNANGIPDDCDAFIPTLSAWAMLVMALVILIGASIVIERPIGLGRAPPFVK